MLRQNWTKKTKSSMLEENQKQYSTTLPLKRQKRASMKKSERPKFQKQHLYETQLPKKMLKTMTKTWLKMLRQPSKKSTELKRKKSKSMNR